jgi:predicted methyltransferase
MPSITRTLLTAGALSALAFAQPVFAKGGPTTFRAALADPARPAEDKARDADRHPAQILAFMGVKPGMKVADFMMGGGYFTRILAKAVGEKGHVYAYQAGEFISRMPKYGEDQKKVVADYRNVTPLAMNLGDIAFAEPIDAIITVQNYHDMHLSFAPADLAGIVDRKLYDALKPGGVLLVIDHVAKSDPGLTAPNTLHRIDPAVARAEIEKAGFVFVKSSPMFRNPKDPLDIKVFDPSIRGHTDQFMFLFRKPAR